MRSAPRRCTLELADSENPAGKTKKKLMNNDDGNNGENNPTSIPLNLSPFMRYNGVHFIDDGVSTSPYITLADLSAKTGVSYTHLSRILSGQHKPRRETLSKILAVLHWTENQFNNYVGRRSVQLSAYRVKRNTNKWEKKLKKLRVEKQRLAQLEQK